MICRTCLSRSVARAAPTTFLQPARAFSRSTFQRQAAAAATSPSTRTETADLTPITPPSDASTEAALSTCPPGTVLSGLNYFKGKQDPVAQADEAYPEWLWRCLEVMEKKGDTAETGAGDEFSKSKKQRRLAAKRQRKVEENLLKTGNMEALAPKIPLPKQSIDLPGRSGGGVKDALEAAAKREELRIAMRKERRAAIKEANYLKSM